MLASKVRILLAAPPVLLADETSALPGVRRLALSAVKPNIVIRVMTKYLFLLNNFDSYFDATESAL